jgi:hypothetical protein
VLLLVSSVSFLSVAATLLANQKAGARKFYFTNQLNKIDFEGFFYINLLFEIYY